MFFLLLIGLFAQLNVSQELKSLLLQPENNWSADTVISFPGEAYFENATDRWTIFAPPTYSAAITPATESDLIQVVNLSVTHGIQFLATGRRHGYGTTLGRLQNGLAVDLSKLNSLHVGQDTDTLTVGPGVRIGDIVDPVYNAGYELQIGSCSCPSLIGASIGAGIGRWSGVYGLIVDALISVRLLTADGKVLHVDEESYPDLFWGIRGAGANFGIITEATYQLHKIPTSNEPGHSQVMNVDLIIPAEQSSAYFQIMESLSGMMPAKLAVVSIVNYNETAGAPSILANWVYLGPEAEGRAVMAPVFDLQPLVVNVSVITWNKLLEVQGFGIDSSNCEDHVVRDIYSANVRKLSAMTFEKTFNKMTTFYKDNPGGRGSVLELETFPNQAAVSIPENATAYPWRTAVGNMIFLFRWADGDSDVATAASKTGQEIRQDFVETSGYANLTVYVSYAHGDESLESIYGSRNLPALAILKKEWDPNNVFRYHFPLSTEV